MMPEQQRSDQVNLSNSQKTTELLPQKHKKIMAFPPTDTFGQLFRFQTSFEAKLFSPPARNRGRMANSTAKSENSNENESNGLVR